MRRSELIQAIAGVVGIIGMAGVAGWTETGEGLIASLVIVAIGTLMYMVGGKYGEQDLVL